MIIDVFKMILMKLTYIILAVSCTISYRKQLPPLILRRYAMEWSSCLRIRSFLAAVISW